MDQQQIESLSYWDALNLAQKTERSANYAGWIIYKDKTVKYILSTYNEGRSFEVSKWEPKKNTGSIVRTIQSPKEIEFLFSLRWYINDEDED